MQDSFDIGKQRSKVEDGSDTTVATGAAKEKREFRKYFQSEANLNLKTKEDDFIDLEFVTDKIKMGEQGKACEKKFYRIKKWARDDKLGGDRTKEAKRKFFLRTEDSLYLVYREYLIILKFIKMLKGIEVKGTVEDSACAASSIRSCVTNKMTEKFFRNFQRRFHIVPKTKSILKVRDIVRPIDSRILKKTTLFTLISHRGISKNLHYSFSPVNRMTKLSFTSMIERLPALIMNIHKFLMRSNKRTNDAIEILKINIICLYLSRTVINNLICKILNQSVLNPVKLIYYRRYNSDMINQSALLTLYFLSIFHSSAIRVTTNYFLDSFEIYFKSKRSNNNKIDPLSSIGKPSWDGSSHLLSSKIYNNLLTIVEKRLSEFMVSCIYLCYYHQVISICCVVDDDAASNKEYNKAFYSNHFSHSEHNRLQYENSFILSCISFGANYFRNVLISCNVFIYQIFLIQNMKDFIALVYCTFDYISSAAYCLQIKMHSMASFLYDGYKSILFLQRLAMRYTKILMKSCKEEFYLGQLSAHMEDRRESVVLHNSPNLVGVSDYINNSSVFTKLRIESTLDGLRGHKNCNARDSDLTGSNELLSHQLVNMRSFASDTNHKRSMSKFKEYENPSACLNSIYISSGYTPDCDLGLNTNSDRALESVLLRQNIGLKETDLSFLLSLNTQRTKDLGFNRDIIEYKSILNNTVNACLNNRYQMPIHDNESNMAEIKSSVMMGSIKPVYFKLFFTNFKHNKFNDSKVKLDSKNIKSLTNFSKSKIIENTNFLEMGDTDREKDREIDTNTSNKDTAKTHMPVLKKLANSATDRYYFNSTVEHNNEYNNKEGSEEFLETLDRINGEQNCTVNYKNDNKRDREKNQSDISGVIHSCISDQESSGFINKLSSNLSRDQNHGDEFSEEKNHWNAENEVSAQEIEKFSIRRNKIARDVSKKSNNYDLNNNVIDHDEKKTLYDVRQYHHSKNGHIYNTEYPDNINSNKLSKNYQIIPKLYQTNNCCKIRLIKQPIIDNINRSLTTDNRISCINFNKQSDDQNINQDLKDIKTNSKNIIEAERDPDYNNFHTKNQILFDKVTNNEAICENSYEIDREKKEEIEKVVIKTGEDMRGIKSADNLNELKEINEPIVKNDRKDSCGSFSYSHMKETQLNENILDKTDKTNFKGDFIHHNSVEDSNSQIINDLDNKVTYTSREYIQNNILNAKKIKYSLEFIERNRRDLHNKEKRHFNLAHLDSTDYINTNSEFNGCKYNEAYLSQQEFYYNSPDGERNKNGVVYPQEQHDIFGMDYSSDDIKYRDKKIRHFHSNKNWHTNISEDKERTYENESSSIKNCREDPLKNDIDYYYASQGIVHRQLSQYTDLKEDLDTLHESYSTTNLEHTRDKGYLKHHYNYSDQSNYVKYASYVNSNQVESKNVIQCQKSNSQTRFQDSTLNKDQREFGKNVYVYDKEYDSRVLQEPNIQQSWRKESQKTLSKSSVNANEWCYQQSNKYLNKRESMHPNVLRVEGVKGKCSVSDPAGDQENNETEVQKDSFEKMDSLYALQMSRHKHISTNRSIEAALGLLKMKRIFLDKTYVEQGYKYKSEFQIKVLEDILRITPYPSAQIRDTLAILLNLNPRSIQIWFQNARQGSERQLSREELRKHKYKTLIDVEKVLDIFHRNISVKDNESK